MNSNNDATTKSSPLISVFKTNAVRHPSVPVDENTNEAVAVQNYNIDSNKPITERAPTFIYNVTDIPPIPVVIGFALELCVNIVSFLVLNTALISTAVCGSDVISTKLFSTMGFMAGLTTIMQCLIGFRVPLLQGPSIYFSLVVINGYSGEEYKCPERYANSTLLANDTNLIDDTIAAYRLQETVWSLLAASAIHCLLGFSGLIGSIAKFIGPITFVPPLILLALELIVPTTTFVATHWGIAFLTMAIVLILSAYMGRLNCPVPAWTRDRGLHITRAKIFRMFGIAMGMVIGWLTCYTLTATGVFSSDPRHPEYGARTDRLGDNVDRAAWFYFPYIGQFGPPRFNVGLFVGYTIAVILSIMDSVADYKTTSRVCGAPDPPPHAVNRGLFVEGACSLITAALGGAHATTTYTTLIGDMLLTGIASRIPVMVFGIFMMIMSLVGKISAFFVSIPKPVLGGLTVVTLASFTGSFLSALNDVDMSQPRNSVALGFPIIMGQMVSSWVKSNKASLDVGMPVFTQILVAIAGNSVLVAAVLGCFLDNTLPGNSKRIRPEASTEFEETVTKGRNLDMGVYDLPLATNCLNRYRLLRYIPILPGFGLTTKADK